MAHEHSDKSVGPVTVQVFVVSTTRTEVTDKSGPLLQAALEEAGHVVAGRRILPDKVSVIRAALDNLDPSVQAVILSGGTGVSRNDGTFEAVQGLLAKELPGFGELFRMLSYQEIGSAAMLSRATAGVMGEVIVFSIPGSSGACKTGLQLILPELGHLVYELGKEAEATESQGMEFVQLGSEAPPPAAETAWEQALVDLGGVLARGERAELPNVLAVAAPVCEVLASAGERAVARFGDEVYGVYGWPDLRRPNSKVLLVGPGEPVGEVVALHRQPTATGVCRRGGGRIWSTGRLGATCDEVTGADFPESGRLFAVEGDAVYVLQGNQVVSWNGRRTRPMGTPSAAMASLMLAWSQR